MLRAIVISDWHYYLWPQFNPDNQRTKLQISTMESILERAMTNRCPIFFGGDLFHTPDGLSNELMSLVQPAIIEMFNMYPVDLYAISGNHDLSQINSFSKRSPSYINTFANSIKRFHNLDFSKIEFDDFVVHGIPYIHYNQNYMDIIEGIRTVPGKFNILLNHTDYVGQTDTNGIIIGKGENINEKSLLKFDLVLSGHIHKRGLLRNNIYSIGAPNEMRVSDMGGDFGYVNLTQKDNAWKVIFKSLDLPRFRYFEDESEVTNKTDYWIKKPKEKVVDEAEYVNPKNLKDRLSVIQAYLKSNHIRSRNKQHLLWSLIKETHNGDTI